MDLQGRTLYLSAGAFSLLKRLVKMPEPVQIAPAELPPNKRMLLGDASDWGKK